MVEAMKILDVSSANDRFRRTGFGVTTTLGVNDLPDVEGLLAAVRDDNSFTEDNDPYGKYDFGSVRWFGSKVFWKIDYYDRQLRAWAFDFSIHKINPQCHIIELAKKGGKIKIFLDLVFYSTEKLRRTSLRCRLAFY